MCIKTQQIIQYIPTPIKLCNICMGTHQTNYNVYVQKLIKLFSMC